MPENPGNGNHHCIANFAVLKFDCGDGRSVVLERGSEQGSLCFRDCSISEVDDCTAQWNGGLKRTARGGNRESRGNTSNNSRQQQGVMGVLHSKYQAAAQGGGRVVEIKVEVLD